MNSVRHHATLYFYDGPQVFEARDAIGGHYVGLLVHSGPNGNRYLIAGVSPSHLGRFRTGASDLRSLLLANAESPWFLAEGDAELSQPLQLELQTTPRSQCPHLPDDGFVLPAMSASLQEARARHNLVLELAVEPPEAATEHRIRARTLAGLLIHTQTLVKHAYGAALRDPPPDQRKAMDRTDAHLMDVIIPAAAGSFRVVLEAARKPDLLGNNELARAMTIVDELFESPANPSETTARVKNRRGHLAAAYVRLLKFLAENRCGLRYAWAEPAFTRERQHALTDTEAQPIIDALSTIADLGRESVVLTGELDKVDRQNRSWRLLTPSGAESGKAKEGAPSLEGLKIGSSYRFTCEEEIQEHEGSGRELRTLYLTSHEPLAAPHPTTSVGIRPDGTPP